MNKIQTKKCKTCGFLIEKKQTCSQKYWDEVLKYCSKRCINLGREHSRESRENMALGQNGRKHTTETIRKMSEARKRFFKNGGRSSFYGKPHTDEIKRKIAESRMGDKNWAKRPEVRKKISEARIREGNFKGKNNPNWKDGRSKMTLRKKALLRDDYTCQDCNLRDEEIMDVDHIKPKRAFPELDREIDNRITLCPNCHKRKTLRDRVLYPQKHNNQHTKDRKD